jgi:hypothetical protein
MIGSCTLPAQHYFRENVQGEPLGETTNCTVRLLDQTRTCDEDIDEPPGALLSVRPGRQVSYTDKSPKEIRDSSQRAIHGPSSPGR